MTQRTALDRSHMGTGKTVVSAWVADSINLDAVLVVCPKIVLKPWREWMEKTSRYGHGAFEVLTWEKLRRGNTPFLSREGKGRRARFDWSACPQNTLVIFDECHYAKGRGTLNSRMVTAAKDAGLLTLFLSATPFQSPLDFQALGYALGVHEGGSSYWQWARKHGVTRGRFGMQWKGGDKVLTKISSTLTDLQVASGMKVTDEGVREFFSDNIVSADSYYVDDPAFIDELYAEIVSLESLDGVESDDRRKVQDKIDKLDPNLDPEIYCEQVAAIENGAALVEAIRLRQRAELYKVPVFLALGNEAIEDGKWPIIFVNHVDTLEEVVTAIQSGGGNVCKLHGQMTQRAKDANVEAFQNSTEPTWFVSTISAGGVGVSLHDTLGTRPRATYISPAYNAVHMQQVFGRAFRSGGKSPVTQQLVFAADTVEEEVCKKVRKKLRNIATLNDEDLLITI